MTLAREGDKPPLGLGPAIVAAWGVLGVIAILAQACLRLAPRAWEPIVDGSFSWWQWVLWVVWVAQMIYSEGYRGFHRAFSPRVVARAFYLARNPHPVRIALAPLFCMGLFHATRKRLIVAWVMVTAIVGVILLVRQLNQPWRGLIDAGVVIGLAVGSASILYYMVRAYNGHSMPVPPDVPDGPDGDGDGDSGADSAGSPDGAGPAGTRSSR